MKSITTTCPSCQKEVKAKLFAAESSPTHSLTCRFCHFRFSIDSEGELVDDGGLFPGQGEHESLTDLEDRLIRDLIRESQGEEPGERPPEREEGTPRKDAPGYHPPAYQDVRREEQAYPKRAPPHQQVYRERPWTPQGGKEEWDRPYPPRQGGISLRKRMPFGEKAFYGLSIMFLFFFLIQAASFATLPPGDLTSMDKTDIQGSVTNETGAAVEGAQVSIAGITNLTTTTNANGSFGLRNVPVGEQTILVRAEGYGNLNFTTYLLELSLEHDGTEDFEFRLSSEKDVVEDKTDEIESQIKFMAIMAILYLVIVSTGVVFVYRKNDFNRTIGIFLSGTILSILLLLSRYETTASAIAFYYFPAAILFTLMLRKEFVFYRTMPEKLRFSELPPGMQRPPWEPGGGEDWNRELNRGGPEEKEKPAVRMKYSEVYGKDKEQKKAGEKKRAGPLKKGEKEIRPKPEGKAPTDHEKKKEN